jgi:RNA polymerase sigma factor (TIGR02999 family)
MAESDVTRMLDAAAGGDPQAAAELLPMVYEELRKLATQRIAQEKPGQTLQATALVHEAYLRLVGAGDANAASRFSGRGHFFAAAAEAMRRILVERARRRESVKHGGGLRRVDLDQVTAAEDQGRAVELLAVNEALSELERHDAAAATLVKLRYFAGLSHQEAAAALGIGRRAADRLWTLAKAWLYQQLNQG